MLNRTIVFVVLTALFMPIDSSAKIYKWVDENGVLSFSDTPPTVDTVEHEPDPVKPMKVIDKRQKHENVRHTVTPPIDINGNVVVELHNDFQSYVFQPPYVLHPFDMELNGSRLWIAQEKGLILFDTTRGAWVAYGREQGFSSDTINDIGLYQQDIIASTFQRKTHEKGYSYLTDHSNQRFSPVSGVWEGLDVHCTPSKMQQFNDKFLIACRSDGLRILNTKSWEGTRINSENSDLIHNNVSNFLLDGDSLITTSIGKSNGSDWQGGGVSLLTLPEGQGQHFGIESGLADSYCYAVATTPGKIWVTHFKEEKGLSVYDRRTNSWKVIKTSQEDIPLGGVALLSVGRNLVIGQQGGLVFLNTETMEARKYKEKDGLPGYIVSDLAIDGESLWVLMYGYGFNSDTRKTNIKSAGLVRFNLGRLPFP